MRPQMLRLPWLQQILAIAVFLVLSIATATIAETKDWIPCVDVFEQKTFDPPGKKFLKGLNVVFHPEKGLKGDLYLPEGKGPHPVVIFIHGGGWVIGSRRMINAVLMGEHLACRGYAFFDIDYELAPKVKSPELERDCKCALRYVKGRAADWGLDKDKVFVTGGSAGGHLTGLVAVTADVSHFDPTCSSYPKEDLRISGAIPFYGVFDFQDLIDRSFSTAFQGILDSYLGPGASREDIARVSPINHVTPDDPPFLIIHGKTDLLHHGQSIQMHEKLKAVGVSSELLLIEGATHAFDIMFSTTFTRQAIDAMDDFLDRRTGRK